MTILYLFTENFVPSGGARVGCVTFVGCVACVGCVEGPGDGNKAFERPFVRYLWFSDPRYVGDLKQNTYQSYPRSSRYDETPFGTND